MTEAVAAVRGPIGQLLAAATRAEKSLKSGMDRAKKLADKKAADQRKGSPGEAPNSVALFDQGASGATEIPRLDLAACLRPDSPVVADLSRPFVVQVNDWCSAAQKEASPSRLQIDEFKTSFDSMRQQQKGARGSKPMENGAGRSGDFNLSALVASLLSPTQAQVVVGKMPGCLQKQIRISIFGVDKGYDKVSTECASMACLRMTLEGTRSVVVGDSLQVIGFMQRKGIAGSITTARFTSFFRSMGVAVLKEFLGECSLHSGTVAPGDLLYLPAGAIVGELCQDCVIGLRWPIVMRSVADKNMLATFRRRKEEVEHQRASAEPEDVKNRLDAEIELLNGLLKAASLEEDATRG